MAAVTAAAPTIAVHMHLLQLSGQRGGAATSRSGRTAQIFMTPVGANFQISLITFKMV